MQPVHMRIVRDDGREFDIDNVKWMMESDALENWAELPHSVSTQENAQYDGGIVTNRRVSVVDRTVKAVLADWRRNAEARAEVISFFSPKHEYQAHLTYQGRTRWCGGVQYAFKCEAGNIYEPCSFTWTLLSPMPFLLSEDNFGQDIALVTPHFGFPFMSAVDRVGTDSQLAHQMGFQAGVYNYGLSVDVNNDGDVETFPRVEIKARGDVKNPMIIKDGTYYVRVLTEMEQGGVLTIDFENRPPKVLLNGANATNLVDRSSSFTNMRFDVGGNTFSYDADIGENVMSVSLYYYKRYLGI